MVSIGNGRMNLMSSGDDLSDTEGKAAVVVYPETVEVVVGCDDGYARHLAVMLLSLFAHSTARLVRVHVLVPSDFGSRARLDHALGKHADRLIYHVLADGAVRNLKQRPDLTATTYYRLLIGDALPPEVERVIYLDCDLVLRCDLAQLWKTSLGNAIVGAVLDCSFAQNHILGLPDDALYFNAGVLLIDLVRWRREMIGEAAINFAAAYPQRLSYNDQCALNWVLRGRWALLAPAWNVQTQQFGRFVDGRLEYLRPLPSIAATAQIVHFNEPGRPWLYMDNHPFKSDYLSYKARTPWRHERPADYYPHNIVIKLLRTHAPILLPVYLWLRRYV